ncbi:MAG: hypothetical protein DRN15_00725 [Thermoprotei archaeon]|nr:MAG: hypothetical protein DRN15_00725 [Thermoprotei archaeon]RLF25685.1 MAG: hypothetical protein DRM97_00960 [Thermoprotei archaeon]
MQLPFRVRFKFVKMASRIVGYAWKSSLVNEYLKLVEKAKDLAELEKLVEDKCATYRGREAEVLRMEHALLKRLLSESSR